MPDCCGEANLGRMHGSQSTSAIAPQATAIASTMAHLRQAIAAYHLAIEALPMSQALVGGDVRLSAYLALLLDLAPIHAAIEVRVDAEPVLAHLFDGPLIRRHGPLAADAVRWDAPPSSPSVAALRLAERVRACSTDEAVGACYVIAGSCLGAAVLAPRLARAFNVPCAAGAGLDYQFIPPPVLGAAWQQVKERLDAWGSADGRQEAACGGARAMMRGLCAVYGGRSP